MFVDDRDLRSQVMDRNQEVKPTPRGHQLRMDGAIARSVVSTLEEKAMLPEGRVWVGVTNGWVTLKGHIDLDSQRATATVLTRHLSGVRGVTNLITVGSHVTESGAKEPS